MKSLNEFDKYLKGNLNEDQIDDFTRDIIKEQQEEEALKNKWNSILEKDEALQNLNPSNKTKSPTPSKTPNYKLKPIQLIAIAATFLLLVAAFFIFSRMNSQPNALALASNHLEQPFFNNNSRQVNSSSALTDQANELYRRKDYQAAIPIYEQLIVQEEDNLKNRLYLGLCHLYSGNAKAAIPYLKEAANSPIPGIQKEANWFLGLAYIKNQQFDLAKNALSTLTKNKGWNNKEASELIKLLESEQKD